MKAPVNLQPSRFLQAGRGMRGILAHLNSTGALASPRRVACFIALLMLLTGCALPQPVSRLITAPYRPQNVFVWGPSLPPQIRRVALLPMACDQDTAEMAEGRDALEPIMRVELAKLRRFELFSLSHELLQARTGRATWGCEDALPHDLFSWLGDSCGCDAVLFCRLTVFRGYAPLAVGWTMRLVDIRTRGTLWAGDEVFDSECPAIQAGVRHYQSIRRRASSASCDEWAIENSPRQFGQYAAAQLLATLPGL